MKRTFRIFLFAAILAAFLMGCSPLLPVSPSGETAVPSEPSACNDRADGSADV